MPTNHSNKNTGDHGPASGDIGNKPNSGPESVQVGYETTDVNIGGVITFLAGLTGFVLIFFGFCFVMGKVINSAFVKEDGPPTRWNRNYSDAGMKTTDTGKRENLANNPDLQQKELATVTRAFPTPRLDIDDSNQATADLHAREDLLLDHYSRGAGGTVRIPIDRAMELVAQHGLPVVGATVASGPGFVGDNVSPITEPLTSGFARTGYELDVIEAREQKLSYGKAEGAEHAQLAPIH